MPAEEAFDSDRMMRPVFPKGSGNADTLAALAHHRIAFQWVREGNSNLILPRLRQPDEVADYTDRGRQKMPALMCGADNNYLALTKRQIDTLRKTATGRKTRQATRAQPSPRLTPRNVSAQLHYEGAGNPLAVRPVTSVGNCIPGLELDFRAVWRRLFQGIVLREYDNLVVDVDPTLRNKRRRRLKGHRLLAVGGVPVVTIMRGPSAEHLDSPYQESPAIATARNPHAVAPLEWSNALADVLHKYQGKKVRCDFTRRESWHQQQPWQPGDEASYVSFDFTVRPFFEQGTAVISRALADAGELTQGLCSPWQNDYRECSCYYWASARPDFVNVTGSTDSSTAAGDNWLQKEHNGRYIPDDYENESLILFEDILSPQWEQWFRIQIEGKTDPAEKQPAEKQPAAKQPAEKVAGTSFRRDILPLFRPMDIQSMRARNIFLADYDFMKDNAALVKAYLTGARKPRMPWGGPYWSRDSIQLLQKWIDGGFKK